MRGTGPLNGCYYNGGMEELEFKHITFLCLLMASVMLFSCCVYFVSDFSEENIIGFKEFHII